MKELSIEEKAKAYDEAIERAKGVIEQNPLMEYLKKGIEYIFPELKESDDEKIRKALLRFHKSTIDIDGIKGEDILAWLEKQATPQVRTGLEWVNTIDDACDKRYAEEYAHGEYCHEQSFKWGFQEGVDWLEKQGEQKSVDNAEPKFHEGEWVVYECGEETATLQITRIVGKTYVFSDDSTLSVADEDTLRLWDITKDAKDGDVLCTYECDEPKIVFILKGTPKKHYALSYHCYYNIMYPHFGSDSEKGCLAPNDEDVKPATKEQRDTLEKAITNAGYRWNKEKLKLEKI